MWLVFARSRALGPCLRLCAALSRARARARAVRDQDGQRAELRQSVRRLLRGGGGGGEEEEEEEEEGGGGEGIGEGIGEDEETKGEI